MIATKYDPIDIKQYLAYIRIYLHLHKNPQSNSQISLETILKIMVNM